MIRKRAVEAFLARPREDFRTFKDMTVRDLTRAWAALEAKPPIWDIMRQHQQVCFIIGAQRKRFAFFLDTGMGKTLLAVALARYFRKTGEATRFLVLVPNKVNKPEWRRNVAKHSPKTSLAMLMGSSVQKWEQIKDNANTLTIETYAGLARMVCEFVETKKGRKLRPSPKLVKALLAEFDGLIMDESILVKNKGALAFRICRQFAKDPARPLFLLNGTPFGKDPTDMWAQLYLVDRGYTLGESLGLFRGAFFKTSKPDHWGHVEHTFDSKKDKLLHRVIAHSSIRYVAEEGDLPRVVSIVKEVRLPQDAQAYYDKAKEAVIAAHGNYQEMKNAFLRMRQISSGYVGYYDDESGTRAQFGFNPNPKLEQLLSIIQEIPPDRKVVVFHEFVFSGSVICRELEKLGIGHVRLYGKTKDPAAVLHAFDHDPGCQVLALNNAAGGFGLNLQVAQYGIYYESPVRPLIRKQTQRRIERQESEHAKVFVYDLVTRGTVDQQILDAIAAGQDLFARVIEGKARLH